MRVIPGARTSRVVQPSSRPLPFGKAALTIADISARPASGSSGHAFAMAARSGGRDGPYGKERARRSLMEGKLLAALAVASIVPADLESSPAEAGCGFESHSRYSWRSKLNESGLGPEERP